MNEWYAKDTSDKFKVVSKALMKKIIRCSDSIPYCYKQTKEDKQQLLVDEPAAKVVRTIYRLVLQGRGVMAIAEQLSAEKVLIPSIYATRYFPENCRHGEMSRWTVTTDELMIFPNAHEAIADQDNRKHNHRYCQQVQVSLDNHPGHLRHLNKSEI